jgi:hypothetical protein
MCQVLTNENRYIRPIYFTKGVCAILYFPCFYCFVQTLLS